MCTLTSVECTYKVYETICISGRNRQIRLYPLSAVDGHETEPIKIAEAKNCLMFATGSIHDNTATCLCTAVKRHIYVYELNRTKYRHLKIKVNSAVYNIWCKHYQDNALE